MYQFKGGQNPRSVPRIVKDDILEKPRVVEALKAGHSLVYVAAWDRADSIDELLTKGVREGGLPVVDGQIRFIGREMLVNELLRHPGVVARYLGVDDSALLDINLWAASPTLANPFQLDWNVDAQVEDLTHRLAAERSTVRVFGAAGNGKTRLVLEAIRRSAFADSVLYASQADDVSPSLIAYLRRTTNVRCTLVVDEVDDQGAQELTDRLATRPPGVRLVLIGVDASPRTGPDVFLAPGLSLDLLVATIKSIVPGIDDVAARAIAEACEGSPKLAVLIARRIQEDPALGLPTVLGDGEVQSALDRYLGLSINEPKWTALSCASLLMRVGWSDAQEVESAVLFSTLGLEPSDSRRYVDQMHRQFGVAPVAGRYRYVSPAILADHLAARQIGAWTREKLTDFLAALTPTMTDSFARRARRLSGIIGNPGSVEDVILGKQGLFRTFDDVENGGRSFIIAHLAGAYPVRTLAMLRRTVGGATTLELREARHSRRDLVNALQDLLWRRDTFGGASDLLFMLAVAENESWGNNATGVWVETFQTYLGRTAADGTARTAAVRRAASHDDPAARCITLQAIEAAFNSGHISRMGVIPTDVTGMPEAEWRPETYGEWFDSLLEYLSVLGVLIADRDQTVASAASATLGELAMETVKSGDRVFDRWCEIARALPQDASTRLAFGTALDAAIRRWELWARAEQATERNDQGDGQWPEGRDVERKMIRDRLDTLSAIAAAVQGDGGFGTRLRSLLNELLRTEVYTETPRNDTVRGELRALAQQVADHPALMDSQWGWLVQDKEWSRAERWIEFLGEADRGRVLDGALGRLAQQDVRAVGWRSLYEMSYGRALDDASWTVRRAAELVRLGEVVQAFDLLRRGEYSRDAFEVLSSILRTGAVDADLPAQLAHSAWVVGLAVPDLRELLALIGTASVAARRTLMSAYLQHHAADVDELRPEVLQLLQLEESARRNSGTVYDWDSLAKRVVEAEPMTVGRLALERIGALEVSHDMGLLEVLRTAWDKSHTRRFFEEIVGPVIDARGSAAWWQQQALSQLPLHILPVDYLLAWIDEAPKTRSLRFARVIGAPLPRVGQLHAEMLRRYHEYGVTGVFGSCFLSGMIRGHQSTWLRGKLHQAKAWAGDDDPTVRSFGAGLVPDIEAQLASAESEESEERFG
ncbi:MAG: hypothetical protein HYV19_04590 [Gemmatimonadetes bacterium]|nr:hypothetical protein [Gemmatimonadota bacterium]